MTVAASPKPRRRRPVAGRARLARVLRGTLYVKLGLILFALVAVGTLYLRLSAGPLSFAGLPERVAGAIAARIGPGWTVDLRNSAIQLEDGSPALKATELDIRNPDGALVLRAPYAIVSVDGTALLGASLQPRSIEFRDLQLRASIKPDGALTFVPSQDGVPVAPPPAAAPGAEADPAAPSPVSAAVASLFDLVVGPKAFVGALDRAKVTNARLTLVDQQGRERATFRRVDATFERSATGQQLFEARLDGSQGVWTVRGEAEADGADGHRARIEATDAPVQDLIYFSGLSAIPATVDLTLSGHIDAAVADGRIRSLSARLASRAGVINIHDRDTSPVLVDRISIDASWEEQRRALLLQTLAFRGGGNDVRLQGELLVPPGSEPWTGTVSGRDAVLAGVAPGDPAVRIDSVEARLSGEGGIRIDGLALRGPALTVDLTGTLASPADPRGIALDVRATGTAVRSGLRLWPEAAASAVRRYLARNLTAGTIESIRVAVALSGDDIVRATEHKPVPEGGVKVEFTIADAALSAAEGLPPLSRAAVSGVVSGTKAAVRVPAARIEMPDGLGLAASEGAFAVDDFWVQNATARINFRLQGGADAVGSVLRAPLLREIAGFEAEPDTLKGRADFRIALPLNLDHIPKFADLPISLTGTISDLAVEGLIGKEKLEGAALAVTYDKGALAIKGEGKIGGSPATIEVRQAKDAGEASLAFTFDDAARARKGLTFGSQLTGPLLMRVNLPLGRNAKPGTRVEADLSRAAVDGLIPGWQKPAGRPGKLALTLVDGGDKGSDIRDLQLDAGTVQVRGTAHLAADGGLDRADLATFKLSPGDDMRAQLERTGSLYKVTIRGNTGDARPFTRSFNASPAPAGRSPAAPKDRDQKDVDLDLALNILTGHNDEAITNASVKASLRRDALRQLDVKGRIGSSNIMAQTVVRGGNPLIVMQAEDAGATLRFLDIYRRMVGGDLVLQLNSGDGPQTGFVTLSAFSLRNEPALRRIIPTQSQVISGRDKAGNQQNVRIDVNEVAFTRARVDFTRLAGRLDFKDAAIYGQAIGFTLGGFIDYARDRVDIEGTFVPAFGLNNAFAQVPLFGPLLGGGRNEGLFAVNFRIAGQATQPTLSVNPLSAVAPGFLRKLFGAGGGEAPAGSVYIPPVDGSN